MRTLIAHLQKYYGVYLLVLAMLFLILWFPNRAVNRYAIIKNSNSKWGICIIDTRTGQDWHYDLIIRYAAQWRKAKEAGDNDKILAIKEQIAKDNNLDVKEVQEIIDLVKSDKEVTKARRVESVKNRFSGLVDSNTAVMEKQKKPHLELVLDESNDNNFSKEPNN